MSIENCSRLSLYKEVALINKKHHIGLVQKINTEKIFIKKEVDCSYAETYFLLKEKDFKGIPHIEELIEEGDKLIVIEEYIQGDTLDVRLSEGLVSEEDTINIALQLCEILLPVHANKIVHRDIKASNIITDVNGKVHLLDFNAARVYKEGEKKDTELIGTENYASPEQYGFAQTDARADIYAMGVLMNKMLTGKFPVETQYEGSLSKIIRKCIELNPNDRYQNVKQLKEAISGKHNGVIKNFIREIPGFRAGKIRNAFFAILWYITIIMIAFDSEANYDGAKISSQGQLLTNLGIVAFLVLCTFYLGNFFGWRDRFPFKKKEALWINILRWILACGIIFGVVVIILSFGLQIIEQ